MIEKLVESAMTNEVETVSIDAAASVAANQLRREGVGSLVAVADGDVVGLVAESDFVALAGERADPSIPVSTFMSAPVVTTTPETSLSSAATTMRREGVKKLPVLDDDALVGIVTTTDLAHFLPQYRTEVEWKGEPLVERRKSFPSGD